MKHLQMGCGSLVCSRSDLQSKRSGEGDPADVDEVERKRTDSEPEQNALSERAPTNFFQRVARETGADEK